MATQTPRTKRAPGRAAALGLRRGEVRLVGHRRGWSEAFAREKDLLARALGPGALAIEHVGSTAVPGLAAKPIVDIAVAVRSLRGLRGWPAALAPEGYAAFGDREGRGEHFYAKGPEARRTVYLHVVLLRSRNWGRYLGFRDALRSSAQLRRRYARLKRRLSAVHPHDRAAYTKAKEEFIQDVLKGIPRQCTARK
jgi:GrpB-like predicted nucleotidyltransferase (UPF0157 family)